jgi:hypothetical protein
MSDECCKNLIKCKGIFKEREIKNKSFVKKHQNTLQSFREDLIQGDAFLEFDPHVLERQLYRAFSKLDVVTAIEEGDIIESFYLKHLQELHFLIHFFVKVGKGQYRHMNVEAFILDSNPNLMIVKTVYDPTTKPWKWSSDFMKRVCFCKE